MNYEAKIITPTQQLYQELSLQAGELFEQIKISAIELHQQVAESGIELYNHPTETATRWQAQASAKADEAYAVFNSEIVPVVKADYQQLINNVTDLGSRTQTALQFFIDNPEKVTVEAFSSFNHALIAILDKSISISAEMLNIITAQANKIISLLVEHPIETMENLYYESLATLLNGYYDIVSTMLVSIT